MRQIAVLVACLGLAGCMDPGTMLLSNLAQAAVVTAIEYADEYAEERRPSAEEAWQNDRLERLREHGRRGEPAAAYRLALHYAERRDRRAVGWMCRAALAGYAPARLQLGHWYNEDRLREDPWPFLDLAPDDRKAYRWYSLAAAAGDRQAAVFRDLLAGAGRGAGLEGGEEGPGRCAPVATLRGPGGGEPLAAP